MVPLIDILTAAEEWLTARLPEYLYAGHGEDVGGWGIWVHEDAISEDAEYLRRLETQVAETRRRLRHGIALLAETGHSQTDIGEIVRLSQQRISQLLQ